MCIDSFVTELTIELKIDICSWGLYTCRAEEENLLEKNPLGYNPMQTYLTECLGPFCEIYVSTILHFTTVTICFLFIKLQAAPVHKIYCLACRARLSRLMPCAQPHKGAFHWKQSM